MDFLEQATGLLQAEACRQFLALATGCPPVHYLRLRPELRPVVPISPPLLSQGSSWDWMALARSRSISIEAVELATQRGLLRFGWFRHHPAWFVTDSSRHVIQARRMDRMRWWPSGPKAWTLAGSQGSWPVGASEIGPFNSVILVEGGPDLLAALHFILLAGCVPTVAAVAMLGAANNIHPEALPLFAGKRVRIVPHLDAPDKKGRRAGMDAAQRWQNQLQGAGANAEIVSLRGWVTETGKDLNDATRLPVGEQRKIGRRLGGMV